MDKKRKKRLEKQIKGLKRQVQRHKEKLETGAGEKDTTHDYWRAEIREFEKQIQEKDKKLKGEGNN